nr:putative colanic acid biosynthesis acetyltransferase [uncultured Rhodoferax sp.]
MIIQGNNPYTGPSFSLAHRIRRQLWNTVWLLFFRPSPRLFHSWRNFLLRSFGATLGQHVHIHPSVKIWAPWNLDVGNFVGIGDGANIYCMDRIKIDNYAVISQGTHLCSGSHDFNSPNFQLITASINIGSRVWLCADSFVGPGVEVAEGSIIAARGLVSKTITEPWCVWAGVPVKKIGQRNKDKVMR